MMELLHPRDGMHDHTAYRRAVDRLKAQAITLPTFAELADPWASRAVRDRYPEAVDPDRPDARNLWRVHWHNGADRAHLQEVPDHVVLPAELTGVPAPIVALLGNRFPMIRAHKVLAAYGCMVPRLVSGRFDPERHRAVWPSTGNYCRGGIAISRILGCRGVAMLPAGMSRERFAWLEQWVEQPDDIVRTPGTESNVKEIYDACNALARDPENVILNQFSEFGNYLVHATCTGAALAKVFEHLRAMRPELRLQGFTAATGSAGTLAAGDLLKERYRTRIVAVEALECPTLLMNGFGEHNIQGIGDKHVPLIHNVMNTDVVAAVSDRSTDALMLLFNSEVGRRYLERRRKIDPAAVAALDGLGFSSIANVIAAIRMAKLTRAGQDDVFMTVATDGAELYHSERERHVAGHHPDGFDEVAAGEVFGQHLLGQGTGDLLELGQRERERIFNLGYYTWVEQQGIGLADFERRRQQAFWEHLRASQPGWDALIERMNDEVRGAA
jgi:cysteine synthase A